MENDSKINERENENIQVYPPVKSSIDNSESKKFLHLFSKKQEIKFLQISVILILIQKMQNITKKKNKNPLILKMNYF